MDEKGFAIFDTMENGVRALGVDLTTKMNRGLDTIRKIVTVYAPPTENPTANYVAKVSEWTNIHPDMPLQARDIPGVVASIIRFEQGSPLDARTLNAGLLAMSA